MCAQIFKLFGTLLSSVYWRTGDMTKRREDKRNCRKERRKSNIKWGERRCIERKWKRNPFLENANTVKHTFDVKYLRWQQSQTNPPPSSLPPYHLLLTLLTAAWSNPINKDRVNINPDIRISGSYKISELWLKFLFT